MLENGGREGAGSAAGVRPQKNYRTKATRNFTMKLRPGFCRL